MLEGSILQKLYEADRDSQKPLNLGVYYKNTLVALCHALEDFILDSEDAPLMITAFQRGKWYLQEAERYGDLADKAIQVAIMAAPDAGFETHPTSQKDNVTLIHLQPDDPVAEEWHLIILSPTYTAMVLCQELSAHDYGERQPKEDLERKFYGFWTFEPELVRETVELAIAHIANYQPDFAARLREQMQQIVSEFRTRKRDDLDAVVSRVVNYLQACQQDLHQPDNSTNFNFFKALDDNILSNELQAFLRMAQLLDRNDLSNPMAASEVTAMAEAMAQLLDLPAWQVKRLNLAGWLHRLGLPKIAETEDKKSIPQKQILNREDATAKPLVLRIMPQLQAIAEIITHQTEAWDGSGAPSGLAYDNIPLESRILRLVADFQQKISNYRHQQPEELDTIFNNALADCQTMAGKLYDPKLVEALALLVMGMQQGMSLQTYQPKIAAGMWLIDSK
ncbi:MAG: DICT sensory domain-containing protein [Pleurocapsa sp.]